MALTIHPDLQVASGVPMVIAGQLFDANGAPLDVTNATLAWGLVDPDGEAVTAVNNAAVITKTAPGNGGIQISVPEVQMQLVPGRYTDVLAVTEGTSTDVFWQGFIVVAANPMNVVAGVVEQPPVTAPAVGTGDYAAAVEPWWYWHDGAGWNYYGGTGWY